MNARFSLALALLLLAAAIPPSIPAAQATPGGSCAGYANTIQAATYTVPAGTTLTFTQPTAIIATRVSVLGRLATADAQPGQDAPGLCIQAESLTVLGAIMTGNGHEGTNDYNTTLATGTAGTAGGALTLNLVDDARTLTLPALNIGPGAILATGNGGSGGTAIAGAPCGLVPDGTSDDRFVSACPGLACTALTTTLLPGPTRTDPCDTLPTGGVGGVSCQDVVSLLPGVWRQDPCPGELPHPVYPTLPPSCEQLLHFTTSTGIEELACRPPPGFPPCTPNVTNPLARGGNGGDAGALSLWSSSPGVLAGVPGSAMLVGHGGNGGHALTAADQGGNATGGNGGASLVYYQGATMGDPGAVAWLANHAPASSQGGNGGSASATSATTIDVCRTVQYCLNHVLGGVAPCGPDFMCQNSNSTATYKLLRCIIQGMAGNCGGPSLPPQNEPTVGCPGEPATEYSGSGGSGTGGADGEAGRAGADWTTTAGTKGVDGSASCGSTVHDGGFGQDGLAGGPGTNSHATGGGGGYGVLVGGHGGDASVRASAGGNGGKGGDGGNGDGSKFCPPIMPFAHPGAGGNGGNGGDSGPGTADGGAGGGSMLFAGDGGNAEGTPGKAGVGGVGGNTGAPGVKCYIVVAVYVCDTDTQLGEWGCGGLNGRVTPVLMKGGAGGTGGVAGQPGKPDPANGPVYDPPSQPSPTHNAHGAGSARECPFP